jgi:hypothetical protein
MERGIGRMLMEPERYLQSFVQTQMSDKPTARGV